MRFARWHENKQRYANELLLTHLGSDLLEHFVTYYSSVIKELPPKSLLVFMSRRGFEVFNLLVNCKLIDMEKVEAECISDRYIQKLTCDELKSYLSNYNLVVVSDDSIVEGNTIRGVLEKIYDVYSSRRTKFAIPMVSDLFSDTGILSKLIIKPVYYTQTDINRFSIDFVSLSHELGLIYVMDLPVMEGNFSCVAAKDENMAEHWLVSLSTAFKPAKLHVKRRKAGDDVGESFSNQYVLLNNEENNPLFKNNCWFYEGIRVFYPEKSEQLKYSSVQFIPSVLFTAIRFSAAVEFILFSLEETSAVAGHVREIKRRIGTEEFKKNDDATYVDRVMVWLLSAAVGKQLELVTQGITMNFEEMHYHFPKYMVEALKSAYERTDFVSTIQAAFTRSGLNEDDLSETELANAYNENVLLKKQPPDNVKPLQWLDTLTQLAFEGNNSPETAFCECARIVKTVVRGWQIPIFFWLKKFAHVPDAGLAVVVVTGNSVSSYRVLYCPKEDLFIKTANPGEACILALSRKYSIEYAAISYFVDLAGEAFASHIHGVANALASYFKNYVWNGIARRELRFDLWINKNAHVRRDVLADGAALEPSSTDVQPDDELLYEYERSEDFSSQYSVYRDIFDTLPSEVASHAVAVLLGEEPSACDSNFTEIYDSVYGGVKPQNPMDNLDVFLGKLREKHTVASSY